MVAPHPDLEKKIQNTKNLIKQNKLSLLPQVSNDDYLDIDTYNKLEKIKPWIEKSRPVSTKAVQPTIHDNILVVCVDFPDVPATRTIDDINNRFFSDTYNFGYTFRNYYNEVSYGKYIPEGSVHGWYRAPQPSTYYTNGNYGWGTYPNNVWKLVEDVVDLVSNDPAVNWNYIDNNGNRIIDYLVIVHSGSEAAGTDSPSDFWAHVSNIAPRIRNGYRFVYYAMCAEYIFSPIEIPVIGVDCHEFGHILGLPDLYDYTNLSRGVGNFSLMGSGSWANGGLTPTHLDAWCKFDLGYMTLIDNTTGTITISESKTSSTAYRYYNVANTTEQFIIENRQQTGFDTYLPGRGLCIWKINYSKSTNDDRTCYKVGLVQADGLKHMEDNINSGDPGDTFPGSTINRTFNQITNPNTILCNGTTRNLNIFNISNSGSTMTFEVEIPCNIPTCNMSVT